MAPACSALCFMAAKLGPCTPARSLSQRALPSKDPGHLLARPHPQQGRLSESRNAEPVCYAVPKALALAWSSQMNEGWKNP